MMVTDRRLVRQSKSPHANSLKEHLVIPGRWFQSPGAILIPPVFPVRLYPAFPVLEPMTLPRHGADGASEHHSSFSRWSIRVGAVCFGLPPASCLSARHLNGGQCFRHLSSFSNSRRQPILLSQRCPVYPLHTFSEPRSTHQPTSTTDHCAIRLWPL